MLRAIPQFKRRLFLMLISIAFLLGLVPIMAFAASDSGDSGSAGINLQAVDVANQAPMLIDGIEPFAEVELGAGYETYNPSITNKFTDPDGDALTYEFRMRMEGEEFTAWTPIGEGMYVGPAFFEITVPEIGQYMWEFRASDGKDFSTEVYSVKVFAYDAKTHDYEVTINVIPDTVSINLYKTTGFNEDGVDVFDEASPIPLEDKGKKTVTYAQSVEPSASDEVFSAHQYVATLKRGMYSVRGVDIVNGVDNCSIGGMSFSIPQLAGPSLKGTDIWLVRHDVGGVMVKADDGTYPMIDNFTVEVFDGSGHCADMGDPYKVEESDSADDKGKWYPTLLNSRSNATLYEYSVLPTDEYASTYNKKRTSEKAESVIGVRDAVNTGSAHIDCGLLSLASETSITVTSEGDFKIYRHLRNFCYEEVIPIDVVANNDGTSTYKYFGSIAGCYYRLTADGKITRAGSISTLQSDQILDFLDGDPSDKGDTIDQNEGYDIENSVLLNLNRDNAIQINPGESYKLHAIRVTQPVSSVTGNAGVMPDYHYRVIQGDDLVDVTPLTTGAEPATNNWCIIKAKEGVQGVALIEVSYDAFYFDCNTGKTLYGASDSQRFGLAIIQIGGTKADVNWSIVNQGPDGFWDSEFDTVYFTAGTGGLSFAPTVRGEDSIESVVCNGSALAANDAGVYEALIKPGNNVLELTTQSGAKAYKLIRGAKVEYTVEKTGGDLSVQTISVGDTIRISFQGLYYAVPKLGGIYNPGYGSNAMGVYYSTDTGISVRGLASQFSLISGNKIEFEITPEMIGEDGGLHLRNGFLWVQTLGNPNMMQEDGVNHRNIGDYGYGANFSASNVYGEYDLFPDIDLEIDDIPSYEISFTGVPDNGIVTVVDADGEQRPRVEADGFVFAGLERGMYEVNAQAPGKVPFTMTFKVSGADDEGSRSIAIELSDLRENSWDGSTVQEPQLVTAEESAQPGGPFEGMEGYCKVGSASELAWIAENPTSFGVKSSDFDMSIVLVDNIDLAGNQFVPLGIKDGKTLPFKGVFKGAGHTIYNLFIEGKEAENAGLFAESQGSRISNANITGRIVGRYNVGSFVGVADKSSAFEHLESSAQVVAHVPASGSGYAGGIVGKLTKGSLEKSKFTGSILANEGSTTRATAAIGGLVGYATGAITDCVNNGTLTIDSYAYTGGIVGDARGAVTNCKNTGSVHVLGSASESILAYSGGIAGNANTAITDCHNEGDIRTFGNGAGGIVGIASTAVTRCDNAGSMKAASCAGGIVGRAQRNVTIQDCFNAGAITGTVSCVGGLAGHFYLINCALRNSYNIGSVENTGKGDAGGLIGLIGDNPATVSNVYNSGAVSGAVAGGLIGSSPAGNITTSSAYWDSDICDRAVGSIDEQNLDGSSAVKADSMRSVGFLALIGEAFNADTPTEDGVQINDGLPILAWQGGTAYTPVEAVTAAIAKLPAVDDIAVSDGDAIAFAREVYESISDEQKAQIAEADVMKLADCESKYKEVKDAYEEAVKQEAVALAAADEAAQAYDEAQAAADEAAQAAETAAAAAAEAAKMPGEAAIKAAQDAEAAAQAALEAANTASEAAAAYAEAAAKAQELAVTDAGKTAAADAVAKATDGQEAASKSVSDATAAVENTAEATKAAQAAADKAAADKAAADKAAADKAAADKAAADKAAKLAVASNINTAKVTAAQVKAASDLGATTITLGPKVKKIAKNAFKGTKIKTVILKTKKLKKKSVKGSLKGSKVKTFKVQIGKKAVNKKFVKKYKKIFTKKNAGKKAKVK